MTVARKPYEFLILDIQEILRDLTAMGCSVDEKSLSNPTYEVIWPLYETMALSILSLSREELQQPAFNKWCQLEYPEMHEESIGCFGSWLTIRQLMFSAGIFDISLRDLVKPDSTRTIRFLSGLINYAKYRKELEEKVAEQQDESLPERLRQLEEEFEATNNEIAAIEAERELQVPAVTALEAENNELWQKIVSLNQKQGAYQGEIRTLKQELNSITDAISGQNYMLQQAKKEGLDLRTQIIKSPEILEEALQEKKSILQSTEIAAEDARKSLHRWELKLESYTKAEKKVQKLLALSKEAQRLLSEQKKAAKEAKSLKVKLRAEEEENHHRNTKLAELTLKGQHFQDLMDKAEQLSLEQSNEEERLFLEAKAQYASFLNRQEIVKGGIAKNKEQVQYLVTQRATVLKTKEELIQSFQEETVLIQQQVLEYYRSLLSCTGPVPEFSA